ncbi:MAG: isopropylmalate synthase [Halobacteriota archaeon]|nr:isopropylmalate synthase [Halobacteriota archaeon]
MYRSYEDLPKIKLPSGNFDINISDSTIRDGSQMPGIVMKDRHKVQIYRYLHEIGVEKIETFLYTDSDRNIARKLMDMGFEFPEVTGWTRANPNDIDLAIEMDGINETGILMSMSDSHVLDKMGLKNRQEAEDKYLEALDHALDHGLKVRCHLEDVTRSDFSGFIKPFVTKIMERSDDIIIRLCDTLSYGIPFVDSIHPYSIPKMILELKETGVKNIETHVHDDFGLGVATSLAGFWYGANWCSLTFLGIGERAGNSELEKILLFLSYRLDGFEKYNLSCLTEFSRYMEKELGVRVPRNKSVVGKNVFTHESGIHTAGVIKNPFTYEPYPPELVGASRQLMIGSSSGTEVIRFKIEEMLKEILNLEVKVDKTDPRIKSIHKEIQRLYDTGERVSCISDEEIRGYVEKYYTLLPIIEKDIVSEKEPEEEI